MLRITVAAILLLMAVGIINQVGSFIAFMWGSKELLKWVSIIVTALTALIIIWWTYVTY